MSGTQTMKRAMKVIQVTQDLEAGGMQKLVLDLHKYGWGKEGGQVISLEAASPDSAPWVRSQIGAIEPCSWWDKEDGLKPGLILKLMRHFRREKPDAVHTHHVGALIYGGIAARLAGVPVILHTEHDAWHLQDPKRARMVRWLYRFVRPRVIADSALVGEQVEAHTGLKPRVILNGIALERFRPRDKAQCRETFKLPKDQILIGVAARLSEVKQIDKLIRVMADLPEHVSLAIAGVGESEEELKALTEELGLTSRVHFLGLVQQMELFYPALDVFCLSSRHEGLPLTLLEAQACDVKAVSTDAGGSREAVDPRTGVVVPVGDPAALAAGLKEVYEREIERRHPRVFVARVGDVNKMAAAYRTAAEETQWVPNANVVSA